MSGEALRTIAVIPARAGSKGLPGKNLKLLAGKPLLAYSIEQAKASGVCDVVLVSTEDDTIARVATEYGAEVPFRRPPELANDTAPAEPVVKHALETYEALSGQPLDIVVYLQPTDVFRTPEMIAECVNRLKARPELDSVFVAYQTHKNYWRWIQDGYVRLAPDLATYRARQERGHYLYREDAGLASASRSSVVRAGKRLGERVDIVITKDVRTAIDIHTAFDFWLAEKVLTEWSPADELAKHA
jgi:CMP-N-acetylneuraminic acid synthetase